MPAEKGKCPPQFVFEMMVAQATRLFLFEGREVEAVTLETNRGHTYDLKSMIRITGISKQYLALYIECPPNKTGSACRDTNTYSSMQCMWLPC
jgi:hypothetical protein